MDFVKSYSSLTVHTTSVFKSNFVEINHCENIQIKANFSSSTSFNYKYIYVLGSKQRELKPENNTFPIRNILIFCI
jgi:hypothetical protein